MGDKQKQQQEQYSEEVLESHVETRDQIIKERKQKRKELLREIKEKMNRMTLGARDEGGDRPSVRQKRFEEMVSKKLAENQKPVIDQLNDMFASYDSRENYDKFLKRVQEVVEKSDKDLTRLQQAILYAVRCLAGYDGKIDTKDYAYFYTLLDNISELYSKNIKIGEIFANIQNDTLQKKDWDVLCANIKARSLKQTPNSAKDAIKLSTSAFLVQLMNPSQRTQLLIEFNKRYGVAHAKELAGQMVQSGAISIKQYTFAMQSIVGKSYALSKKDEQLIRERRRQAEMLIKRVGKTLKTPYAINAAERLLNRKAVGSLIVTGIGVLGMITNYMAGLSSGKGIGRFFAGLKSPYFLISMGVTAGGVHMLGSSMTPGKSVGLLNRLASQPRRLDNPFGTLKGISEKQDRQMRILADICADHPSIENYLLYNHGFDDLWGYYAKKKFDRTRLKSKMLTTKERESIKGEKKRNLYEDFLDFVENKQGNKKGATILREAARLYGEGAVERMIFDLTVASYTLGINTTASFFRKRTPTNVKYYDVFLYRQGVASRPEKPKSKKS